ncbi:MAG: HAD family phosphatase [Streptococcaceae bacterium]|nr:HAD family phosphatase [Streptococcaceae bacterium]
MMIKAIIFDLGGVIIDLGFERMTKRFEELGIEDFGQYFTPKSQVDFFEDLELGLIEPEEFYDKFRQHTDSELTNAVIEETWNLILKDFDKQRMALLTELSATYPLYLFSNTNAIHAKCFEKRCLEQTGHHLEHYFTTLYYSHELHLRKPTVESFKKVLDQANLTADETLFIDDNEENIKGARKAGLKTYHLQTPEQLTDIDFTELLSKYDN